MPNAKTDAQEKEIMSMAQADEDHGPGADKQKQKEWDETIEYAKVIKIIVVNVNLYVFIQFHVTKFKN